LLNTTYNDIINKDIFIYFTKNIIYVLLGQLVGVQGYKHMGKIVEYIRGNLIV